MAPNALEKRAKDAIARIKFPEEVEKYVSAEGWIRSILLGEKYREPDPDFLSRMLAAEVIFAGSIEEVFRQGMVRGLQEMLPDTAGYESEPFELDSIYVMESDYETGNPCYTVMRGTFLISGEDFITTTGATSVQAQLIALIAHNEWPIKAKFGRGDVTDKSGKHMMFLLPPD